MNRSIAGWRLSTVLVLTACVVAWSWAQDRPASKPSAKDGPPISVMAFNDRTPLGYLGHPLGSVVRVTGVCIDGDKVGKLYAGKVLLRVESVNGRKLAAPSEFVFNRTADGVIRPKPGDRFDYTVHEYGGFDGHVKVPLDAKVKAEFSGNVVGIAAPGFAYTGELTVHKSHPIR